MLNTMIQVGGTTPRYNPTILITSPHSQILQLVDDNNQPYTDVQCQKTQQFLSLSKGFLLVSHLIALYAGASDIGHDIWQDILVIIAKRHNSLNASCQCEYRQTVEYVSTDRLILDLTHQGRFDKNLELCCILDSCIENPVRH